MTEFKGRIGHLPAVIFLGNSHFQALDQTYETTYKITAPATEGHGG